MWLDGKINLNVGVEDVTFDMNEIVKFCYDNVNIDNSDKINILSDYFDELAQAIQIENIFWKQKTMKKKN